LKKRKKKKQIENKNPFFGLILSNLYLMKTNEKIQNLLLRHIDTINSMRYSDTMNTKHPDPTEATSQLDPTEATSQPKGESIS
jgi:hypothetical protein